MTGGQHAKRGSQEKYTVSQPRAMTNFSILIGGIKPGEAWLADGRRGVLRGGPRDVGVLTRHVDAKPRDVTLKSRSAMFS
jgi:hypothetical protein